MLSALGALSELTRGATEADAAATLNLLAQAVSDVSHLHLRAPGVREATLRHASAGPGGALAVGEITVTATHDPSVPEPSVRRL
jgi:hypothetical protein